MRVVARVLIVVLTVALLFWTRLPALDAGPLYEDNWVFTAGSPFVGGQHPHLRLSTRTLELYTMTWQVGASGRELRLTNIGLHLLCAALIFWLCLRLGTSELAAWVGALGFALNSLAMQSTVYVASGRAEILMTLGLLVACLSATSERERWWLVGAFGLLLAALAKQTAIVGLALVPLTYAVHKRRAPWVGVVGILVMVAASLQLVNVGDGAGLGWWQWVSVQATATWRLLWISVLPFGQTIDYDYDSVPHALRVVSIAALLGIGGLSIWFASRYPRHRRRPLLALACAWPLIVVTPRLIAQVSYSYLNEHQWYSALVGVALLFAGCWDRGEDYFSRHTFQLETEERTI